MKPGSYKGTISGGMLARAKSTNAPTFVVQFLVTQAETAPGQVVPLNPPLTRNVFLALNGAAIPYTMQKLASLGYDGMAHAQPHNMKPQPDGTIKTEFGAEAFSEKSLVALNMKIQEWQGQDREVWELADWGGTLDMPGVDASVLNAFGQQYTQYRQQNPTQTTQHQQQSPASPIHTQPQQMTVPSLPMTPQQPVVQHPAVQAQYQATQSQAVEENPPPPMEYTSAVEPLEV